MSQTTAIPLTPRHFDHSLNQNAPQYTGLDRSHPNRAVARLKNFEKPEDYSAFMWVLGETGQL